MVACRTPSSSHGRVRLAILLMPALTGDDMLAIQQELVRHACVPYRRSQMLSIGWTDLLIRAVGWSLGCCNAKPRAWVIDHFPIRKNRIAATSHRLDFGVFEVGSGGILQRLNIGAHWPGDVGSADHADRRRAGESEGGLSYCVVDVAICMFVRRACWVSLQRETSAKPGETAALR